jgi:hypothetical protein
VPVGEFVDRMLDACGELGDLGDQGLEGAGERRTISLASCSSSALWPVGGRRSSSCKGRRSSCVMRSQTLPPRMAA